MKKIWAHHRLWRNDTVDVVFSHTGDFHLEEWWAVYDLLDPAHRALLRIRLSAKKEALLREVGRKSQSRNLP